jgi:hypothetical protein
MPEIKFPSDWLKINDNVQNGDIVKFVDAGRFDEEKESWEFVMQIYHNNEKTETKKFNLNKTNYNAVKELYGSNSDNWVGKTMKVALTKARNPQLGKLVDSILLEKPTDEEKKIPESAI